MSIQFVNIHGDPVYLPSKPVKAKRPASIAPAEYHRGWQVEGIPPGALEAAEEGHARVVAMAEKAGGKVPEPFDRGHWLMNAKRKRIRSKAYEIEAAARECAQLAEKAGWLRVAVVEQKREAA